MVLGCATAAHANPSSTDLENQIDKQWRQLEPTIENYDAVHEKLQKQQAKAQVLQAKIEPLQLEVQVQLAAVGQIAAKVYMAGPSGTFTTLLNAGSSTEALNMLGEVEHLAADQRQQVSKAVALRNKYEAQAKPVNALVASLKVQQTALDKQRTGIQSKIKALDAERVKAFGSTRPPARSGRSPAPWCTPATPAAARRGTPVSRSARATSSTPPGPTTSTARA